MRFFITTFISLFILNNLTYSQDKNIEVGKYPKIVVGLVIDQMRWDYLYRYYDRYTNDGFKRLLKDGFSYENAQINYAQSVTAVGHASLYTGSVPALHGITGNEWIDRKTSKYQYCVSDEGVKPVGGSIKGGKMSPKNLLATTIGDELKLSNNFRSRVFGVSIKDRGGILPAGRSADAAYWFDDSTGNWMTSSYYVTKLPTWVSQFNNLKIPEKLLKENWNLLYSKNTYLQSTEDNMPYENNRHDKAGPVFPHVIDIDSKSKFSAFKYTPASNTLSFDFAKQLINSESLGKAGFTDMLCLSIAGTDYIGHAYGPNSLEIEDTYLRLDLEISSFLKFLDEYAGQGNYLFFLSSDHGVAQVSTFLDSKKINSGSNNNYALVKDLNKELKQKFGENDLVKAYFDFQFYLDNQKIDSLKLPVAKIKEYIKRLLSNITGISAAFNYDELNNQILPQKIKE
ncbi:MAG: alkaline phosphatase family protein, partial [Ferruginibacter sp.]